MASSQNSQNSCTHCYRGQSSQVYAEIRYCHCGHRAALRTSQTQRNMGRRFLGCALYGIQPACGFFEWVDEEIDQVQNLLDKIDVLEKELKKACGREKYYLRLLLWTWAGIVFFLFMCYLLMTFILVDGLERA